MLKFSPSVCIIASAIALSISTLRADDVAVKKAISPTADSAPALKPRYGKEDVVKVSGWIREKAPSCPPDLVLSAAQRFLDELSSRRPELLEKVSANSTPTNDLDSPLLSNLAVVLSAPQHASLREGLARKRVELLLRKSENGAKQNVGEIITKVKTNAQSYYNRLLEGRLDDDDLALVLKRATQTEPEPGKLLAATPRVLSATDIISEFGRHNQVGSAIQKLHAYTVEGTLQTATGETQRLVLSRMVPDRFRLVVKSGDAIQVILASNGSKFWQETPERHAAEIPKASLGASAFLGEFVNPLLAAEGYSYEKLPDGVFDNRKVHRIKVKRLDDSDYASCVDVESYREIGRENGDGSSVKYTDFREIAGVTFAFHEEIKDAQGRSGVFQIQRMSSNPGLVQAYFEPAASSDLSFFKIEQWLAHASATTSVTR